MAGSKSVDYRAKFNDFSDPTTIKENQCTAFIRVCPSCGTRFPPGSRKCINCGKDRPRCKHTAMTGETVCRSHCSGRPYSIYSKLAATLADGALEELVEADDRDLSQEYALAKVALSAVLDNYEGIDSPKLLSMVKDFFTIAEKKKNIEQGQLLNISWNDDLVNSLRTKIRRVTQTIKELLEEYIEDEELRNKILLELRNRMKTPGNQITVPLKEGDYKISNVKEE